MPGEAESGLLRARADQATTSKRTPTNAMDQGDRAQRKQDPLPSSGSQGQTPSDEKLLARALAELSATRKTILMYPAGHNQIQKSLDRARTTWDEILSSRPEMTIGSDKDGLIVGRDSTKLKDAICKEFSSILRDHDIAVAYFRQGLSSEELAAFLRVIAGDPERIRAEGGIEKALANEEVRHIRVQCIDYSKFLHTEEEEIQRRPRGKTSDENDSLWGGFVTHLILGTLTDTEKGIPLRSANDYAPRVIAAYLNENRLDHQMALDSYEQTVEEHLNQDPASGGDNQTYRVANLRNLSALLEELQPTIRHQFLDATYQQCAVQGDSPVVENLLSGMSHGLILEMLRHANKQGSEISPTLLNLVQKIAQVKESSAFDGPANPTASQFESSDPRQRKEILDLFDREAYETYVTSDYGETLKALSQDGARPPEGLPLPEEIKDEVDSLESRHLDAQIARALIAFMEGDPSEDEYKDYAAKTFRIANDLIGEGEFTVPLEILNTLQRHVRDKPNPAMRSIAEGSLQRFRYPTFLSKALAAFDKWRNGQDGKAQAFLTAIGPDIVPQALNLYLNREQSEGDQHLLNLLAIFSNRVAEIARQEITTRGGPPLIRLIRLVRRLGTHDLVPELRPLLLRDDRQIQMEILETLVRFQDPESTDLLRKFLKLKNAEDQLRVIEIAGMCRVADLAQDLASMVRTFSFFRADYVRNGRLIEALGRIGHASAIPALERLARTKFSLYPKQLADLKLLLFQSLRLYEAAPLSPLLRMGSQSKDTRIRTACRESLPTREGGPIESPSTTGEA
jgi:hypothetical protein